MREAKLAEEVKGEIKTAQRLRLPWWGVLSGIIVSFLCAWLFDNFGKLELVLPALNSVAVLGFLLVLKRKLWPYAWFWGTMAILAALHVALVLLIPWTDKWIPAMVIAAIDSADVVVLLTIISVVGRFMTEPRSGDIQKRCG